MTIQRMEHVGVRAEIAMVETRTATEARADEV